MKQILVLIKSDGIGGVERRVAGLLDTFADRGIECDVLALAEGAVSDGLLANHTVRVLRSPLSWSPLRRLHQYEQLRACLRSKAYDMALAFGPSPNALVSLARRSGTVTVISENGNPFVPRRRLWNRTVMHAYRRADVLIVHTERLAHELRQLGAVPPRVVVSRVTTSRKAVPVTVQSPRALTIATVGRLVPSKRVGDLIAAFAAVARLRPAWTLLIVGDGPERALLEADAAARGLGDRVRFTGYVSEPWRLLATASLFVLCSAHEGFSNVLVEAAVSGCALVSSDCRYGPREILEDGRCGALYPVGDVEALSVILARLMDDDRERLALAGRAHASAGRYLAGPHEDPFLDLLLDLASRHGR